MTRSLGLIAFSIAIALATLSGGCGSTPPAGESMASPSPAPGAPSQPSSPTPQLDCEANTYSSCPDGCVQRCVGSCETCDDCDGPGSCASASPSDAPPPAPAAPAAGQCEAQTYSSCPDGCQKDCVGSCDGCDDCDGPGSCSAP